ncbi:MAG: hypothetical protein O8C62_13020 [Candidatus Methanoperedens sp.]|nr:hypothetical protein [Candidatus Methanoperedens sp.]
MKLNENKKLLLMSKINLATSVFMLAWASFWFLQNIYEGKPYYEPLIFFVFGLSLLILLLIAVLIVSGLANIIFNLRLEYTSTVDVISVASMFSFIIIGRYLDKKGDV